jgi:hypothetical protein
VIVRFVLEVGALLAAVRVRIELPEAGLFPQEAVTPAGRADDTARLTLPVNPPALMMLRVVALKEPGAT